MKEIVFRPLSEFEKLLLEKLFELDFVGREELRQQFSGLLAKHIDDNGSLEFKVHSSTVAPIEKVVIAEARCPDSDTDEKHPVHVNILLHVKDGKLWMLEIYKDDSSPILRRPNPNEFILFTRAPKKPSTS